jgi:AraC-like DNA-binding protein
VARTRVTESCSDTLLTADTRGDRSGVESVSYHRVPALPEIEVLRCDSSMRGWTWHHTAYSICVALSFEGEVEYRYRCRQRRADARHQIVFEPGEVHTSAPLRQPASFRVLFVPPRIIERAVLELVLPGGSVRFPDDAVAVTSLQTACRALHQQLDTSGRSTLEVESRFAACLREWVEVGGLGVSRPSTLPHVGKVRIAEEYLSAHPSEPVGLEDLARHSGLSRFHLAREFKRVFGVPPHTYQLLLRVGSARKLLEQGATRAEAAERVGFADASHLARHFKKLIGVPPGRYAPRARSR